MLLSRVWGLAEMLLLWFSLVDCLFVGRDFLWWQLVVPLCALLLAVCLKRTLLRLLFLSFFYFLEGVEEYIELWLGLEEGLDFFFESSSGSFFVRVALLLVTILLAVDKWFSSPAAYFFPKIPLNFFSCFVEVTVFSLSTSFFFPLFAHACSCASSLSVFF